MGTYRYLLIGYVFAGCVYWLWMAVGAWQVRRRVPVLADLPISPPRVWPRLSIVIPACNEAPAIQGAVESILAQDYPNLEIVLIDDRSTDETGVIIDRLAASDFRILRIHVTRLPDGWLGKVHALCRGAEASTGEWMLLTDADVHLAPAPSAGPSLLPKCEASITSPSLPTPGPSACWSIQWWPCSCGPSTFRCAAGQSTIRSLRHLWA